MVIGEKKAHANIRENQVEGGVKSRPYLWTAKSGHAENPGRRSVSLNPVCRRTLKKKTVNRNEPVAAKPVRRSETLDPWGMYAAGKKENKNEPRGERPVGCKASTGLTTGDPWGQVQPSKKKRGQAGTAGGLGS